MIYKMYCNGGIYRLDNERGKGKIYDLINKSTPKPVKKLFSEPIFADAPTGTYYFCFDGYQLVGTWLLNGIYDIFDLVHKSITHRLNLLMTVDYEGIYSYVATMPVGNKDVRLVFLDRTEPECRDLINRYPDLNFEKTVVAKDIIISRYELINQFNAEIHRVYEENKYYLSKEYEEKCLKENAHVCQEYTLEDVFGRYMRIFDKYLENPEQFWKDSFFNLEKWNATIYKTTSELKKYFDILKNENIFIGSKIEKIMVMGLIFNDDRPYYTFKKGKWYGHYFDTSRRNNIRYAEDNEGPSFDSSKTENVALTLDEPISLFVRNNEDIEQHFDIDFTKTARFMMKPNSFDFWEKSYIGRCKEWQDVSKYFSKNIIGHKIIDVNVEAYSKTDEDIDLVEMIMDNGFKLCLETDLMTGYMSLFEEKGEN